MIESLPPSSAYLRALDPERAGWTVGSYQLAAVIDLLQAGNWQRQGDPKADRPKPSYRPGDASVESRRQQTVAERARAFRARQRGAQ